VASDQDRLRVRVDMGAETKAILESLADRWAMSRDRLAPVARIVLAEGARVFAREASAFGLPSRRSSSSSASSSSVAARAESDPTRATPGPPLGQTGQDGWPPSGHGRPNADGVVQAGPPTGHLRPNVSEEEWARFARLTLADAEAAGRTIHDKESYLFVMRSGNPKTGAPPVSADQIRRRLERDDGDRAIRGTDSARTYAAIEAGRSANDREEKARGVYLDMPEAERVDLDAAIRQRHSDAGGHRSWLWVLSAVLGEGK